MLYKMLVSAVQQYESVILYTFPFLMSLPPPPSQLSRSLQHARLQFLYSSFPLMICFTRDSVYMAVLLSPAVSACPFSTGSVGTIFSRFHTYALMCNTCFSLSDLLHSIRNTRFVHHTEIDSDSLLWLSNIPLCVCTTFSLPIHLSMDV